jgi:hypothetical protein
MVFNTLVALDKGFNVVPELARAWQVSPDGKRVTFQLQRGAKFHDGTDFNAEAVKWNVERILDPQNKSPQRAPLEPAIASVTVVDPNTVAIDLKKPFAPLLAALAERPGFIVSPSAAKQMGPDFGQRPVGTGPFKFVEWVRDSQVTLERFPDYWEKGKPHLDRVIFRVVPDPTVRLTMVRTGEVDIATDVDAKDIPGIRNEASLRISEMKPAARWTALQWRVDEPPFNNKALRQAIALAIDRNEIRDVLLRGFGEAARGPVSPGLWWSDPAFQGIPLDLELAKKKLAEAGTPRVPGEIRGREHTAVDPADGAPAGPAPEDQRVAGRRAGQPGRRLLAHRAEEDELDPYPLGPAGGSERAPVHPVPQQGEREHDRVQQSQGRRAAGPGVRDLRGGAPAAPVLPSGPADHRRRALRVPELHGGVRRHWPEGPELELDPGPHPAPRDLAREAAPMAAGRRLPGPASAARCGGARGS